MEYYDNLFLGEPMAPVTELPPPPPPPKKPIGRFRQILGRQLLASVVLCAGILSMGYWWPEGENLARKYLVCQEIGPIEEAAQAFVRQVLQGESIPEAVAVFCQDVAEAVSYTHLRAHET